MSGFSVEQLDNTLPNVLALAQKGINNEIFLTYTNGSYQISHRTNLSDFYRFPYLETNQFLLEMRSVDVRKIVKVKEEGWHSNYIIDGQLGLQLVDPYTRQAVASSAFDIWKEPTGELVAVIGQMPQGISRDKFQTRQSKRKFLQFDFRTEILQAILEASRMAGAKKAIVISVHNHYKITNCPESLPVEQIEQINRKNPLSFARGLIIIDRPALSAGFNYNPEYNGNLLINLY
ncbi:hypothetical protein JW796_04120 [Candidatus Dojkabacteria bacterium]|nr:hypothetical protein [Candidatus Dojkabacteria bacterium]